MAADREPGAGVGQAADEEPGAEVGQDADCEPGTGVGRTANVEPGSEVGWAVHGQNQEQRSVSLLTRDHTGLKASLWCWAAEYLGHDVSGSHTSFWRAFKKMVRQLTRQSAGG